MISSFICIYNPWLSRKFLQCVHCILIASDYLNFITCYCLRLIYRPCHSCNTEFSWYYQRRWAYLQPGGKCLLQRGSYCFLFTTICENGNLRLLFFHNVEFNSKSVNFCINILCKSRLCSTGQNYLFQAAWKHRAQLRPDEFWG